MEDSNMKEETELREEEKRKAKIWMLQNEV